MIEDGHVYRDKPTPEPDEDFLAAFEKLQDNPTPDAEAFGKLLAGEGEEERK